MNIMECLAERNANDKAVRPEIWLYCFFAFLMQSKITPIRSS